MHQMQYTMAAMMDDSVADIIPASTNSSENNPEDARIESLLTEKLMSGHALLEAFCPSCNTPLIKKKSSESQISQSFEPSSSLLPGIPYCVSCAAHVVMTEQDVKLLELCDSLKDHGTILVALGSDVDTVMTMNTESEAAAAVERIAARIQATAAAQQVEEVEEDDVDTPAATTTTRTADSAAAAATDSDKPTLPVSALFCGSTASRQMCTGSPTPSVEQEKQGMRTPALDMLYMEHEEEGFEADLGAHESFRAMTAHEECGSDEDDDHEELMLSLDEEENDGDDEGTFDDTTVGETVTSAPPVSEVATSSPPQVAEKKDEDEEDGLGDYSVRYVSTHDDHCMSYF
jgi:hypothetical protein